MMRSRFLRLLTSVAALPLSACRLLLPKATRPVRRLAFDAQGGDCTETIVMLPGRLSPPEEFVQYGIVKEVQKRRPSAQILIPDLHMGYYMAGTADVCLHEELLAEARLKEHKITLLGVSMGGLGSLIYGLRYPGEVDELLLLSPFVGEETLIAEIRAAGGLQNWNSDIDVPKNKEEALRKCWAEMKKHWLPDEGRRRPQVRLAVGLQDRLLKTNTFFADTLLTRDEFIELEGGHDWDCWLRGTQAIL